MCNEKMPTGVLAEIISRLATITDEQIAAVEPQGKVEEGVDTVVGEADDNIKRLFTLANVFRGELETAITVHDRLIDEIRRIREGASKDTLIDNTNQLRAVCHKAEKMIDLIMTIMWHEVRCHAQLVDKPKVGLRAGWQLCFSKSKKAKSHSVALGDGITLVMSAGIEPG